MHRKRTRPALLPQLQLPELGQYILKIQSPIPTITSTITSSFQIKSPDNCPRKNGLFGKHTFIESPNPTRNNDVDSIIDELLFIGNEYVATNEQLLKKNGIKHVLNVSHDCKTPCELYNKLQITYKHVCIKDHSDAPIMDHLDDMLNFVHNAIIHNEPILVHCKKGWSRSASVIIAYIITKGRPTYKESCSSFDDALKFVSAKRQNIQPNLGFCMMLNNLSINCGFKDSFF